MICKGQDPTFSQFDYNPLYYNPAMTGLIPNTESGIRMNMLYRSLWTNVPSSFNTYSFSADMQSPCIKSGQGIIAVNDVEGEGKMITSKIGGLFSYRILLNKHGDLLQAGAEVDYVQTKIDWGKLVFSDQVDSLNGISLPTGNINPNKESSSFPDFHFGVVTRFQLKYHQRLGSVLLMGFAAHHITEPNESILGSSAILPMKLTFHGYWLFILNNKYHHQDKSFQVGPTFMWEFQDVTNTVFTDFEEPFQTFDIGLAIKKLPLYFSLAYRNKTPLIVDAPHSDALIVHVALSESNPDSKIQYRIGYSYDLTLSKLSPSTGGSHEISIQMIFPRANPICSALGLENKNKNKLKQIPCPGF